MTSWIKSNIKFFIGGCLLGIIFLAATERGVKFFYAYPYYYLSSSASLGASYLQDLLCGIFRNTCRDLLSVESISEQILLILAYVYMALMYGIVMVILGNIVKFTKSKIQDEKTKTVSISVVLFTILAIAGILFYNRPDYNNPDYLKYKEVQAGCNAVFHEDAPTDDMMLYERWKHDEGILC